MAIARSPPKKVPVFQLAVDGGGCCVGVGGAVSNRGFITGPTGMNYGGRGGEFSPWLVRHAPSAHSQSIAGKCRQLSPFGPTLSGLANTYWEIIFTHGCEKVAGKSRHKRPGKAGTNFTEPRTSIFSGRAVHSLHYIYPIHTFLDRPLFHSFAGLTPSVAPSSIR